jgi:large subunit ribosomal protein L28
MSRRCEVTGAVPALGHRIIRSGKSKKSGGIGMHVTANTPRKFRPNLRRKKLYVPELGRHVTVRLTARALKTIDKKGAYSTLKRAGVI